MKIDVFLKTLAEKRPDIKYLCGFESYSHKKAKFSCDIHGDFFCTPRLLISKSNSGCSGCRKERNTKTSIRGFGINDVIYDNGTHPLYLSWYNIIRRCEFSKIGVNFEDRYSDYKNVDYDKRWRKFSVFLEDFKSFKNSSCYKKDWQIDKDLFSDPNNKCYSAKNCCLLPVELNNMVRVGFGNSEDFGVCYDKEIRKYFAYIKIGNSRKRFGSFEKKEDARMKYILEKFKCNQTMIMEFKGLIDDDVYDKLISWNKCMGGCSGVNNDIKNCTALDCALYHVRPYK